MMANENNLFSYYVLPKAKVLPFILQCPCCMLPVYTIVITANYALQCKKDNINKDNKVKTKMHFADFVS